MVKNNSRSTFGTITVGKTTINVSDCISFKTLNSALDNLSLGGLEF